MDKARASSRRRMLKAIGLLGAGGIAYILIDSSGLLGQESPIRRYIDSFWQKELADEASQYGDDGDRVAYAVNYLELSSSIVPTIIESWNSLSPSTRAYVGGSIPTATATIVADELSNQSTAKLAQLYPNLLWIHAHTNALFTFPWIVGIQEGDKRLMKMADLRFSEEPVEVEGQVLTLYYPEDNPYAPNYYGKRRYVREGFVFFARNFGDQLENMNLLMVSTICEQSTAAAVTIQYQGAMGDIQVEPGETSVFSDTRELPLYCFSTVDNSISLGPDTPYGALAVGMNTMKWFRERHPSLEDSCSLTLGQQGYIQIDNVFMEDPAFKRYLYQGVYQGYFCTSPVERTIAWKEYQTVGLVPEQTVRGLGVATIGNFHPANFQPLSLLKRDPSIVELLVQHPEVYVPSEWNRGHLFKPYDENENC